MCCKNMKTTLWRVQHWCRIYRCDGCWQHRRWTFLFTSAISGRVPEQLLNVVEECPRQQQAKSVRIRPGREDPRAHIRRFQIRILQDEIRTCGRNRMHTMNCRTEVQTAVKFLPCMQTFEYCSYASIIVTLPHTLGWP